MPSAVFSVIKKRPCGKSAGLSGITIDHVKAAIISSEDCLGLLTKFFNQILSGQLKYPEELRSSRLTALVKNSKMCDSTSSALVTTIPQVYGTLLSDSAWTLNMRFRSFIWPDNLPHNLICKCFREITTTHLLNCKHFITFRSFFFKNWNIY
ncbi:hypothetical protein P9112_003732 [Eukaryota sp. TZLM1-RC]